MPISTTKNVVCKNCGKKIKSVRIGDVLGPDDMKRLYGSLCMKCKLKKVLSKTK